MGTPVTVAVPARTPAQRLWRVVSMVRYRFFLYAGLLPYLLGAAWAWAIAGTFDAAIFWSGLSGVVLAVIGVEAFNEYFDARMGTDRVFNSQDIPPIAQAVFWIGKLTLAAALAVGIPAFFLALAPSTGPWRTGGFLREVGRFAVPAGVAAGLGVLAAFLVTLNVLDAGLVEARTVATTVLVVVGLYLILALEATGGRRSRWVAVLCGALLALYLVVLAAPGLREFYELEVPSAAAWLVTLIGCALAIGFLWLTDDRFVPGRSPDTSPVP